MRQLPLLAASVLPAAQAPGQEKYDFKPQAKAGDVFTTTLRRSETLEFRPDGLMSGLTADVMLVGRTREK